MDLRAIGEKLKVDNVLEGSVLKAGNKLSISAQLIRVNDNAHLWSDIYDRELEDVFAIQDEISQAIVRSLKVKLLDNKTVPLVRDYTKSTEAYELYLKGLSLFHKDILSYEKAIDFMEKAIKADPDFVPAYNQFVKIQDFMTNALCLPPWDTESKIHVLLQKALEIDDQYGHIYTLLGLREFLKYDWKNAEANLKRGIELTPSNPLTHFGYAAYLMTVGRMNDSIVEVKRTLELDPLSGHYNGCLAIGLCYEQQLDQVIGILHEVLELDPNDYNALYCLGEVYAVWRMYHKGISILKRVRNWAWAAGCLGFCYGKAGKKQEAQKILDSFLEQARNRYFSPFIIAMVYAGLGDKDSFFEYLDKAYEVRDPAQFRLKVLPLFAELKSDLRWNEQMKKRGLAD